MRNFLVGYILRVEISLGDIHILLRCFTAFKLFNDLADPRTVLRVAFDVEVDFPCLDHPQRSACGVKGNDRHILARLNVSRLQRFNRAVGHVVVFREDDIEFNAFVKQIFNQLLPLRLNKIAGRLIDKLPIRMLLHAGLKAFCSTSLRGGAEIALKMDDFGVLRNVLLHPFNGDIPFISEVAADPAGEEIRIGDFNLTVDDDHRDAGGLRFGENRIPALFRVGRKEDIIDALIDEVADGGDLLSCFCCASSKIKRKPFSVEKASIMLCVLPFCQSLSDPSCENPTTIKSV